MDCCNKDNKKRKKEGFLSGLIYGLVPHIGCIAFIVFSVLGATTATTFFRQFLLNPYFFHILVGLSILFATISAIFYFKKQGFIDLGRSGDGLAITFLPRGLKRKWRYLLTLYGTTVAINLLLFMVIFPIAANLNSGSSLKDSVVSAFGGGGELQLSESASLMTLEVKIPCPGHASLIIGELKGISGVEGVKFQFPNLFDVGYDPEKTSKEQMLALDVFNTYHATVINDEAGAGGVQLVDNTEEYQPQGSAGGCCAGGSSGGCGCGSRNCGR